MGGGGIKKDAQLDCKFGVARGSRNHVVLMDRGSKDPADSKNELAKCSVCLCGPQDVPQHAQHAAGLQIRSQVRQANLHELRIVKHTV